MDFPPIYGFNECSEMGNDIFAPSIFIGGCNLRCPYCMNSKLINPKDEPQVDIDDVIDYIRKNDSEWIMISGGEPTCMRTKLLRNLINMFIGLGCKVGLSTNGAKSDKLADILPFVNYVALDIKSHDANIYDAITYLNSAESSLTNVFHAQYMLMAFKRDRDDFDYELRTTLYPEYINEETLKEIGSIIREGDKWVLQQFRHAQNVYAKEAYDVDPYSEDELQKLLKIAQGFSSKAELRYV